MMILMPFLLSPCLFCFLYLTRMTCSPRPHLGSSRDGALHGLALSLSGLVTLGKVSCPLWALVSTSDKWV